MPDTVKSLLISGSFTEDDLRELTVALRTIEQRHPDGNFMFAILNCNLSMTETEELMKRIFPRLEGDEPTFKSMPNVVDVIYQDIAYKMTTDLYADAFVITPAEVTAFRGCIEVNDETVHGVAWSINQHYEFIPYRDL